MVTYTYRGDGLRSTKTVTTTNTLTYTWDINSGLPEVLQDGTWSYVYGLGLISQTDGNGVQNYILADGLGSTRRLTSADGSLGVGEYSYDAFGAVRYTYGTSSTEYRFNGQQDDASLAYLYLRQLLRPLLSTNGRNGITGPGSYNNASPAVSADACRDEAPY